MGIGPRAVLPRAPATAAIALTMVSGTCSSACGCGWHRSPRGRYCSSPSAGGGAVGKQAGPPQGCPRLEEARAVQPSVRQSP